MSSHSIEQAPDRTNWLAILVAVLLTLAMAGLRLVLYPDRVIPLSYGLPLLVGLWHRDRRLLYGMAMVFMAMTYYKVFHLLDRGDTLAYQLTLAGMMMANIWVVTGVIHALIVFMDRLALKNQDVEVANVELQARNEELAAREEEIARQNEELQAQTEELEQQAEELRQQNEEMEHQSAELQTANEELVRREHGLQTLLASARWIRSDLADQEVLTVICEAAGQVMDAGVVAAAVVQERDGRLAVRGHHGLGEGIATTLGPEYHRTFAALVAERQQTAYIRDLETRPDLAVPQPSDAPSYRSILATPVWVDNEVAAVLKVYAHLPRDWSENDFRVAEWLAAQAGLALQAFHYQREVEQKRRQAEAASIQKTRFLAAVSHDVRTPANAISLLADLIEQTAEDPDAVAEVPLLVRDLKASARGLVDLVSDVLDLAKFDAGKMDVQLSDFPVRAILDHELRQSRPAAQAKGLELHVACPTDQDVWVHSDRMKLTRVLANLVGNAIKFTDRGRVDIECRRSADGGAEIVVADTGVGISSEHLQSVFDEFFQLRNPERDRNKGTGLGLAICQRLVDGLGCRIAMESTQGVGTRCTLVIPASLIIDPPAAKGPAHEADGQAPRLEGLRVLLVEDHETTRKAMARLLAAQGAVVLQAGTSHAAMSILRAEHPHILLLDLMLPDQDGTAVLQSLLQQRPESLKTVLAVSGDVRDDRVAEVRALGADDLIAKPLTARTLVSALERHLPRHPRTASGVSHA